MPYSANPPGFTSRLKTTVSWPARAIFWAANSPAGPAPIMKTVATLPSNESRCRGGPVRLPALITLQGYLKRYPLGVIELTNRCDFSHLWDGRDVAVGEADS